MEVTELLNKKNQGENLGVDLEEFECQKSLYIAYFDLDKVQESLMQQQYDKHKMTIALGSKGMYLYLSFLASLIVFQVILYYQ